MDGRAWELQQALADQLKAAGLLDDPSLEAAFRSVPRHLFLPGFEIERAYTDDAIGTKFLDDGRPISSSSQPAIMAIMLDQLGLAPGQSVLEIGAGTGYNAALMAYIVGEHGRVVSIDIDDDIVQAARRHLQDAGFDRVQVVRADGFQGLREHAPYDRIILTVGSSDIAPAWWEQLAAGGRLVVPLELAGHSTMASAAFEWKKDHLESLSLRSCGFMMIRGEGESAEYCAPIAGRDGLCLGPNEHANVDPDKVAAELQKPVRDIASEVSAISWQLERDVRLWLMRFGMKCFLMTRKRSVSGGLADARAMESSLGVMRHDSLCTLMLDRQGADPNMAGHIWIYRYGDSDELAMEILSELRRWDAGGRPSAETIRIRAYPANAASAPDDAQIVIEKKSVRLLLDWPSESAA